MRWSLTNPRAIKTIQATPLRRGAFALQRKPRSQISCRFAHNPADDPSFTSAIDNPPNLVRAGKRHGPGLIVLGKLNDGELPQYLLG